jgi:Carboxypeptidase regulatory-like domain
MKINLIVNCAGLLIFISCAESFAAVTGRISGTVTDPTGSAIPGAAITITNTAQGLETKTQTDVKGDYSFPSVNVGTYDILFEATGFRSEKRTGLAVDANAAVEQSMQLELSLRSEEVTVSDVVSEVHVETASTQLGEVVSNRQMTSVALNGRSYTDLLALQPGIVPVTTQLPDSIVMAGASVAIPPSGVLNAGNQSISGQREDANGYMVNGGDVKELMNGGTSIVPNLDSIAEFRILTNNFDPEFGNYSGGVVNVVTKAGTNEVHGGGFEFLRNTDLDARNFFSPERSFYRQNQFGGTIGGPIRQNRLFFFGDYQGTRQSQGIDTGLISVPTLANRTGNFAGQASSLTGDVSGPYLAKLLTQRLGYGVAANEPYYFPGCTTPELCVFPNAVIPQNVWSAPSQHLVPFIPTSNSGDSAFSTSAYGKILRDDKGSFRLDANSQPAGLISGYYFFDDYTLNNPYPTGQGGANVPGFGALNLGRAQLVNLGDTKTFGATLVNELRLSYMRYSNNVGQPSGGVGPSLASQGFAPGSAGGIVPLAPQIEGIENVIFPSFVMGTPITNLTQANNTYSLIDNLSKVRGSHTLKVGMQVSLEQVNVHPNPTFNGSFLISGTETGNEFADFLIGVASNYNQADSQAFYGRHKYAAGFAQDSWRVRSNLTLNFGVRWDLMQYWSEKFNQIPAFNLGQQSKVYPTAPTSLVYPTDPGVPPTLVPQKNRFAPRLGIAYSPSAQGGLLGKIIGGPGKTSIRTGYGIFYSVIEGNTIAIDEPQPPYGLSYTSPAPPLFATPFISAANGTQHVQPFPLVFPPLNASINHPNPNIDYSPYIPQAGMTAPYRGNTYPYSENYFLSLERQLGMNTLVSLAYVGSQAHHLLLVYSANPGSPALCLALSKPTAVAPGTSTCGPFAEDATYVAASGQVFNGTRGPLGSNFSNDDYEGTFGNSSYNSMEASIRHSSPRLDVMLSYTFSKSLDEASSISDIVDSFNYKRMRALSAWDLTHNFVATYRYQLPLDRLSSHAKSLTRNWVISGITRASTGFPVTLAVHGDNSLQGSVPNGVNNHSIDLPDYLGGNINLNGNPRNAQPYFDTSLYTENALGTPGTASRRGFHGPGAFNFDIALLRNFALSERKALQFRFETFNTFNHAQFFGPAAVNGDFGTATFGQVVQAAPPRLVQLAMKLTF